MRKYRRLTREDRIFIERRLEQGKMQTEIADELGVHRCTISKEIKRNKAVKGPYRWRGAHAKAQLGRPHRICYRRKIEGLLEELVRHLLEERLSPDQISQRLKLEGSKWSVSHETIYKWIYYVAPEYKRCLRWKSRIRQKRAGRYRRGLSGVPRKLIDARPSSADLRTEPGHWERDLLEGRRGGPSLLVMQDRHTRLTVIRKVKSKFANEVNRMTAEALQDHVVKTITNDNGVEFGCYTDLEKALGVPVYFCHAYTSWERRTVENTNGLLRQFAPKHTDFSLWSEREIQELEDLINARPRKGLGYRCAKEIHENKKIKLIKGEGYYRNQSWKRGIATFKEEMIREIGFYLEH